ncbi:TetR/AcrR family transcriptional regulator [Amycolatopsis dongchuanensis]|uniref:TetR/AcrR family transcriptional regulator n=1 Tax=Amycolatopsis dongchuanensis TaxID=1070866 RepID=A0ABP9QRN7_9PSEU
MPSTRKPTRRGERTRAAILDAAAPLFARHGYRGAPLASVAEAARLTQPGLLHHFPSKERLLLAVLEERDREAMRWMRDTWSEGGSAALRALVALVARNTTTPELVQLFTVLVGEGVSESHPAHEYFEERYERLRGSVRRAIAQGQDTGEFRTDVDAAVLANLVLAMLDGLQIQWLLDRDQDMTAAFEAFVRILLEHLAPRDEG